jgi:hypothetical protein
MWLTTIWMLDEDKVVTKQSTEFKSLSTSSYKNKRGASRK